MRSAQLDPGSPCVPAHSKRFVQENVAACDRLRQAAELRLAHGVSMSSILTAPGRRVDHGDRCLCRRVATSCRVHSSRSAPWRWHEHQARVLLAAFSVLLVILSASCSPGSDLLCLRLGPPGVFSLSSQMARLVPPFIGSGRRRMDGDRLLVIRNLFRAEMLILSPRALSLRRNRGCSNESVSL
jgi:hypothetical protein